ncbi:Killer toxin subunits alpha/beta 6 [Seiridium cupressi]
MGDPPMPAPMNGSICGPTVLGSAPPVDGSKDGLFADFIALGLGTNRIISFGGWDVSTSPTTLDGVDIDWEYPGAPDIPGNPPGQDSDGPNYLATLKVLRDKLPEGKSLSIAAPALYWYLKAFPIGDMAQIVDYIVYMTYDLHGQWDYNNKWADDGCPAGNCLRSHVNLTETELALAMITKANVPSNKVAVGISSYGRSFKMADPNCSGPICGFVGPESAAKPGICTGTAGYISNAEINRIIRDGGDIRTWFDTETMTDYLIYEGTEWVAYMSESTKAARMARWKELNFAGTIDWVIDLNEFDQDSGYKIPKSVTLLKTGPPGPACKANCGHKCSIFCGGPCLSCRPNGDSRSPDFVDPSDPDPPPFPPPTGDPPPGAGDEVCQPDVKTDSGLCPNGNVPIFDPVSMQVRCDFSADEAQSYMTSCQAALDEDYEDSKAEVELSSKCCSAGVRREFGLSVNGRASNPVCPAPNPPPLPLATFTCDFDKWPNVCANTRSAISSRGKTNTLTFVKGFTLYATRPWFLGKWLSGSNPGKSSDTTQDTLEKFDGWGLIDCQNICADLYGNAFLLVNSANVYPGERSYDPWWDNKLFKKTIGYATNNLGQVILTETIMTNSAYCQYLSPGKKIWNGHEWAQHGLSGSFDRRQKNDEFNWYLCDSYPGYSGPAMVPRRKWRRGRRVPNELPAQNMSTPEDTFPKMEVATAGSKEETVLTAMLHLEPRHRHPNYPEVEAHPDDPLSIPTRNIQSNMTRDDDLCFYLGDACSSAPGDAGNGDGDIWDTPDPPAPPSLPPTPEADCNIDAYNKKGF